MSTSRSVPGSQEFLRDCWYLASPSADLAPGRLVGATILGEPVLLGRRRDGAAFALRDICPHRGIPLSEGCMADDEVECSYHGWRFSTDGTCTAIPSLVEGQDLELRRIRVRSYPVHEASGLLWIYMPRAGTRGDGSTATAPPDLPPGTGNPRLATQMMMPCHVDHAVIGLMDPAHGPFVHRSWWWRSRRSIHAKERRFGPSEYGFTMLPHRPSRNSAAYRLLGGKPVTQISFRLPGVRIEHVRVGSHALVGLTAVTPVTEHSSALHHVMYWTMPWLTVLKPVLRPFARSFLEQDRRIVEKQQRGLRHHPSMLLIDDADVQARWYYRLKKAHQRMVDEQAPFENPVTESILRWRS